jgi:hypothetical protein
MAVLGAEFAEATGEEVRGELTTHNEAAERVVLKFETLLSSFSQPYTLRSEIVPC